MTVSEAMQLNSGDPVRWTLVDPEGRGQMPGYVVRADATGIVIQWADCIRATYLFDIPESAANLRFITKTLPEGKEINHA